MMTNEETVQELIRAFDVLDYSCHMDNYRKEAFNNAYNALRAEQGVSEEALKNMEIISKAAYEKLIAQVCELERLKATPCEDAVSREAVDELSKALVHTTRDKADFLCNFWEGLRKLPPVTPKPLDSVFDEAKAEIAQEITCKPMEMWDYRMGLTRAFEIIDKYREGEKDAVSD